MLRPVVAACAAVGVLVFATTAAAAGGGVSLDQYKTTVSQEKYRDLLDRGLDLVSANDRRENEIAHHCGVIASTSHLLLRDKLRNHER